jgi:hypothetical protein
MIELGFDAQASTPSVLIELCQQISYVETSKEDGSMTKTNQIIDKDGAKLQTQPLQKSDMPSKSGSNPNGRNYRPLHQTNGHDAKEYKVLLAQVKRMQSSYEAGGAANAKPIKPDFQKNATEQMYSFTVNANKDTPENNGNKRKGQSNFVFDEEVFDEFETTVGDDCDEDNF